MTRNRALILTATFCVALNLFAAEEALRPPIKFVSVKRASPVDFDRDILPILKNNCLACHNQTTTKGDLNLETPETMLKGGESGPAIDLKESEKSLLLRLAAHLESPKMPPKENKVSAIDLTGEELGLLKLWIEQGAHGSNRAAAPVEWQPLPAGVHPIYAVALTRDHQYAACGRGNDILIYHIPSQRMIGSLNDPAARKVARRAVAHLDQVRSLAFSPDGSWLASGAYREIKLWKLERRPEQPLPFSESKFENGAISLDGKKMVTSSSGSIRLWDGKKSRTLRGAKGSLQMFAFSPDNIRLFGASSNGAFHVWSSGEGTPLLSTNLGSVLAVRWMADGNSLGTLAGSATNRAGAVLTIWNLKPGFPLERKKDIGLTNDEIADFAPGRTNEIVMGGKSGVVRTLDLESGKVIREFKHGLAVRFVAVRPDGKRMASTGGVETRLWNYDDGKLIASLGGDCYATERAVEMGRRSVFSTNEFNFQKKAVVAAETNLTGQIERVKKAEASEKTNAVSYAEKKKKADMAKAGVTLNEKALAEFEKGAGQLTNALAAVDAAMAGVLEKEKAANEGKALRAKIQAELDARRKQLTEKLAAAKGPAEAAVKDFKKSEQAQNNAATELELARKAEENERLALQRAREELKKAEASLVTTEKELMDAQKAATQSASAVSSLAFSRDNRILALGCEDGSVRTWNSESGERFEIYRSGFGEMAEVAMTEEAVLGRNRAGKMKGWKRTAEMTLARAIDGMAARTELVDRVNALRFSPDGKVLFSGGGEPTRGGEIKLWDPAVGKFLGELKNVHSDAVLSLDLSPDGTKIASGAADKFVRVVDLATGKILRSFEGHTHHVLGVGWQADGRSIVSAGADNLLKVWDTSSGERKKNIEGFNKEATSIQFVGLQDQFIATGGDHQVRLLKLDGSVLRNFEGFNDFVYSAAVSPDGAVVIAAGEEGTLRIWNGTNGVLEKAFGPN